MDRRSYQQIRADKMNKLAQQAGLGPLATPSSRPENIRHQQQLMQQMGKQPQPGMWDAIKSMFGMGGAQHKADGGYLDRTFGGGKDPRWKTRREAYEYALTRPDATPHSWNKGNWMGNIEAMIEEEKAAAAQAELEKQIAAEQAARQAEMMKGSKTGVGGRWDIPLGKIGGVEIDTFGDYDSQDDFGMTGLRGTFRFNKGGGVNINPANKGKFTAKANAAGQGVQEYARKVLAAPEGRYDPATRKQANFARNAAAWHKADGGYVGPLAKTTHTTKDGDKYEMNFHDPNKNKGGE